jgi:SRSO17 transposase
MQRLFTTARWDADLVPDDLRGYVAGVLGDPDGVLIGDDTGFEKGGTHSAGVQRQYTGTAGKITNCQIGVFLAYASGQGRALVDRELYLPRSWTGDPLRLAAAGVPAGTGFATKPELLQQMIKRAAAAGMPFGWVAADEAYGDNGPLRDYLEEEEIAYVLAVSRDHLLAMPVGRRRADELAARLPRRLAETQPRRRRQGRAPLRLGVGRCRAAGDLAVDPEEHLTVLAAGLLPLPHPRARPRSAGS